MKIELNQWVRVDAEAGPGVWVRSYRFSGASTSNAFVVRFGDGELAIISPPCHVDEAGFTELDALGRVSALVAPNGFHHLGLPAFAARYPDAKLYANPSASKRIAKKYPKMRAFESMEALEARLPAGLRIFDPPHMKTPDAMAWAETPSGVIWYSNDVLGNLSELPSAWILRKLFEWTKSAPGFKVNRLVLKFFRPQAPFAEWFRSEIETRPPIIVVPGHGDIVAEGDVAAATREALSVGL